MDRETVVGRHAFSLLNLSSLLSVIAVSSDLGKVLSFQTRAFYVVELGSAFRVGAFKFTISGKGIATEASAGRWT